MYASIIGKKLIDLANKQEGKTRTSKEFIEEVYFPLFYDHPKYLHWTINSPFVQGYKSNNPPSKEKRTDNLKKLHEKVSCDKPDASFAIGFGAADDTATTSGQMTSIEIPVAGEDIYASWIGAGLGIGVNGGLVLLIDNLEILNLLFEGWKRYRELLNDTNHLKGNQIETWNGQWLTFALNNPEYRQQLFTPLEQKNNDSINIPTQNWVKVLFAMSRRFPDQNLRTYVYSLGQTNVTLGFIQINLPEIKREIDMYDYLFGELKGVNRKAIDDVYNTEFGFKTVCMQGAIGLREIQPKDLKEYFPRGKKEISFNKIKTDEKSLINYNIYLSWVIAMLNNKTLIQTAEEAAQTLAQSVNQERGKKIQSNNIRKLLESNSRKMFINNITDVLKEDPANNEFYNSIVNEIDKMQADKFPYFLILLKFKYEFLNSNKSKD
ncbi:MAG: hypothetical protein P4L27_13390 [Ignavibacteriaceae bacterium]|nr:hypothetical protein [Ignavibacteriaceae bacterium]